MNLKKKLTVMVVGSMVFVLAVAVEAQARPGGPNRGMKAGLGGLKAFLELKLSDSQQAEMGNIITKYQDQTESLRNRIIGSRKNLATVLRAEQFNEEEARKAFREASAVREDMFVLRARMMTEMKAVLTPEQLELLEERKAQRLGRIRHRFDTWAEKPSE